MVFFPLATRLSVNAGFQFIPSSCYQVSSFRGGVRKFQVIDGTCIHLDYFLRVENKRRFFG